MSEVATLNKILEMQYTLQSEIAALFMLLIIFMVGVVVYLREFKNRHTLQNLAQTSYQLAVKQARKLYKTYKNLGDKETRPDALPLLERYVIEHWLATQPRIMKFTEEVWLPIIRVGKFNRPEWKQLVARWIEYRLIAKKNPRARAGKDTALIAARGEVGMERKLTTILSHLPASSVDMPEMVKNSGQN